MSQGFNNGNDGNNGLGCTGCLVAVADNINRGERTHPIVYTYYALSIILNERKTMLDTVEACLTTISQDIPAKAEAVTDMLIRHIEDSQQPPERVLLGVRIVERESVARIQP